MMQKNEYRRNENKRSFRTERKPVKNAGQDTCKVKNTQNTYKAKNAQDTYKVKNAQKPGKSKNTNSMCPVSRRCGGCQFLDIPYEKQLQHKQKQVEDLLKGICPVKKITGMENPFYYRNKVHAVFGYQKGKAISGVYEEGTHEIVPVEQCMIEDKKADEIIGTIRGMLKSFKIKTYDEDTGYGPGL